MMNKEGGGGGGGGGRSEWMNAWNYTNLVIKFTQ